MSWRLVLCNPSEDVYLPGTTTPDIHNRTNSAGDAAWNMAIDEALLESLLYDAGPPTLRLYGWLPPAVSVGRFQAIYVDDLHGPARDDSCHNPLSLARCRRLGLPVVRRPTGGRAILHDRDLTYSIVAPHGGDGIIESYKSLSTGIRFGLERLKIRVQMGNSPPDEATASAACFASTMRSDLAAISGPARPEPFRCVTKLVGSAQCRRGDALLQQGTIPITWDHDRYTDLFGTKLEKDRPTCLTDLLGREPSWLEVAQAIAEGFRQLWGREIDVSGLSELELQRALRLMEDRYGNDEWTKGDNS